MAPCSTQSASKAVSASVVSVARQDGKNVHAVDDSVPFFSRVLLPECCQKVRGTFHIPDAIRFTMCCL